MTTEQFADLIAAYVDGQAIEFKNSLGNWNIEAHFVNGDDIRRVIQRGALNYRKRFAARHLAYIDERFVERNVDDYSFVIQECGKEITVVKAFPATKSLPEEAADAYLAGRPVYYLSPEGWRKLPLYRTHSDIVKFFDEDAHFNHQLGHRTFSKVNNIYTHLSDLCVPHVISFVVLFEYGVPIGILKC
jgi:hypothetical protein